MAANQDPETLKAAAALALAARSATLATVGATAGATADGGVPHASLVTPGWDTDGQPVLLLSALAAHTRHLRAHPACALLFTGPPATENPQTAPRLCLSGTARVVPGDGIREGFLKTHPYAQQYADFGDFAFWKVFVTKAHYIGGFARAYLLPVAALQHEISTRILGP